MKPSKLLRNSELVGRITLNSLWGEYIKADKKIKFEDFINNLTFIFKNKKYKANELINAR